MTTQMEPETAVVDNELECVYRKPGTLTDTRLHYCPGCGHGVIHRVLMEVIEELGIREKTVGVAPVGCAVFAYHYMDVDMQEAAHGRASGYIAVHRYWRADPTEYFEAIERIMLDHGGRPHWGKLHTLTADRLRNTYPHFEDFVDLRDRLDPERRFANRYLDRVLGA